MPIYFELMPNQFSDTLPLLLSNSVPNFCCNFASHIFIHHVPIDIDLELFYAFVLIMQQTKTRNTVILAFIHTPTWLPLVVIFISSYDLSYCLMSFVLLFQPLELLSLFLAGQVQQTKILLPFVYLGTILIFPSFSKSSFANKHFVGRTLIFYPIEKSAVNFIDPLSALLLLLSRYSFFQRFHFIQCGPRRLSSLKLTELLGCVVSGLS